MVYTVFDQRFRLVGVFDELKDAADARNNHHIQAEIYESKRVKEKEIKTRLALLGLLPRPASVSEHREG